MKEQATGLTSVRNDHYSLLNNPEDSRSRVVLVTLSEMNGLPYDLMCTAVQTAINAALSVTSLAARQIMWHCFKILRH